MKVLLIGHSYVRYLQRLGESDVNLTMAQGQEAELQFALLSWPGKDYQYLIDHPEQLGRLRDQDSDVIIVILGGNSPN